MFEGWARDREVAARLLASRRDRAAARKRARPRRPDDRRVLAVDAGVGRRGRASGARAYSTLNEGPGRTLWFGVGDDESIERLRFFRDELGPTLARLLEREGPVDVFALAAQGLQMGDELHMRSQATGNLLMRDLAGRVRGPRRRARQPGSSPATTTSS